MNLKSGKCHSRYRGHTGRVDSVRGGAVLVVVLVCIVVVLALTMAALRTSVRHRRQLSRGLQLQQTWLLLEAAAESKAFEKWRDQEPNAEKASVWEITMNGAFKKNATIKAERTPDEEGIVLTATIGDPKNEISLTRRSMLLKRDP